MWIFLGWFAAVQKHLDSPGEFGDMFGAANALFSALAFATLIYTVFLQRNELALQRAELSATRAELAGQRVQLEAQNELMRRDGFESTFFRVLGVLAQIVDSIDLAGGQNEKGRDCFRKFYERIQRNYAAPQGGRGSEREFVEKVYATFYQRYQGDVGHYFRTLYNLIKLVDQSGVEDKHFYTNLVRAQLSNQETLLLFYNCSCGMGREKFKPMVEKYALLKNMPRDRLLSPSHISWFELDAYGKEAAEEIQDMIQKSE